MITLPLTTKKPQLIQSLTSPIFSKRIDTQGSDFETFLQKQRSSYKYEPPSWIKDDYVSVLPDNRRPSLNRTNASKTDLLYHSDKLVSINTKHHKQDRFRSAGMIPSLKYVGHIGQDSDNINNSINGEKQKDVGNSALLWGKTRPLPKKTGLHYTASSGVTDCLRPDLHSNNGALRSSRKHYKTKNSLIETNPSPLRLSKKINDNQYRSSMDLVAALKFTDLENAPMKNNISCNKKGFLNSSSTDQKVLFNKTHNHGNTTHSRIFDAEPFMPKVKVRGHEAINNLKKCAGGRLMGGVNSYQDILGQNESKRQITSSPSSIHTSQLAATISIGTMANPPSQLKFSHKRTYGNRPSASIIKLTDNLQ